MSETISSYIGLDIHKSLYYIHNDTSKLIDPSIRKMVFDE